MADDEQSMKERLAAVKFRDDGALTLHLELIELAGEDHQTSETPSARSRSRRSS